MKIKCKRCGGCCEWWVYYQEYNQAYFNDEMLERMKVGGVKVYRFYSNNNKKTMCVIWVPLRCKYLLTVLGQKTICLIHGKEKPKMCKKFPYPNVGYMLPPDCAFVDCKKCRYTWHDFVRII